MKEKVQHKQQGNRNKQSYPRLKIRKEMILTQFKLWLFSFLYFMAYQPSWVIFIPKPSLRNSSALGEKEVHTFPKNINSKINVIAWLERSYPLTIMLLYSTLDIDFLPLFHVENTRV